MHGGGFRGWRRTVTLEQLLAFEEFVEANVSSFFCGTDRNVTKSQIDYGPFDYFDILKFAEPKAITGRY